MMGSASIEVTAALRERLMTEPVLRDQISIKGESDSGDGYWLLHVSSPLLPAGYNGVCNLIVEGKARFRRDQDT